MRERFSLDEQKHARAEFGYCQRLPALGIDVFRNLRGSGRGRCQWNGNGPSAPVR